MLKLTKKIKVILVIFIVLIIISIATYFTLKKTREGFAINSGGTWIRQGCYRDTNERALTTNNGNGQTIESCQTIANKLGHPHIGLQNGGECWSGPSTEDYAKYIKLEDSHSDCSSSLGGAWSNQVYKYVPNPPPPTTTTTQPITTTTQPITTTTRPITTQPTTTKPIITQPITTQPITTQQSISPIAPPEIQSEDILKSLSLLNDCELNTTEESCKLSGKCTYTNNGCYSRTVFSSIPSINSSTLTCSIIPYSNIDNNYRLTCNDSNSNNKYNYVFNSLSTVNNCDMTDTKSQCNIIRQINGAKSPYTLTFINNSILDNVILDNNTVKNLTDNFDKDKMKGILYASDDRSQARIPIPYIVEKESPLYSIKGISSNVNKFDSSLYYAANGIINNNASNINKIL